MPTTVPRGVIDEAKVFAPRRDEFGRAVRNFLMAVEGNSPHRALPGDPNGLVALTTERMLVFRRSIETLEPHPGIGPYVRDILKAMP